MHPAGKDLPVHFLPLQSLWGELEMDIALHGRSCDPWPGDIRNGYESHTNAKMRSGWFYAAEAPGFAESPTGE
jgi:hypothetical protein